MGHHPSQKGENRGLLAIGGGSPHGHSREEDTASDAASEDREGHHEKRVSSKQGNVGGVAISDHALAACRNASNHARRVNAGPPLPLNSSEPV